MRRRLGTQKRFRRRRSAFYLPDRSHLERITGETKLCPDCKLKAFIPNVPRAISYTRQPAEKTTLRLCSQLRAYAKRVGKDCKYFRGMNMDSWLKPRGRK